MAVLKPRKISRESNPQRPPSERLQARPQRPTLEEVPIHTLQRPPEMRTRPIDPRMDPRRDQRPHDQAQRRGRGASMNARLIIGGFVVILIGAALVFALTRDGSTTVIEQQPKTQTPVTGQELQQAATPEQVAKAEGILESLSKHILLPKQTPQVMQITNPDELIQKDPFFAGSQSGDVLVIYRDAGKALIYSPARDIIVNVGPVQVDPPQAPAQAQ